MLKVERVPIELVPIDSIKLDKKNARKHPERNIETIKNSLERWGQQKNIVVWKDTIIAGNGTWTAAKALGWDKIEIRRLPGDSLAEAKAYALIDNHSSDTSEWDFDIRHETTDFLLNEGFPLEDFAFDLDDLLKNVNFTAGEGDEEDKPKKEPQFKIEIEFKSCEELNPIYEELLGRGLMVKAKIGG